MQSVSVSTSAKAPTKSHIDNPGVSAKFSSHLLTAYHAIGAAMINAEPTMMLHLFAPSFMRAYLSAPYTLLIARSATVLRGILLITTKHDNRQHRAYDNVCVLRGFRSKFCNNFCG